LVRLGEGASAGYRRNANRAGVEDFRLVRQTPKSQVAPPSLTGTPVSPRVRGGMEEIGGPQC
jgi:hypothetical protein